MIEQEAARLFHQARGSNAEQDWEQIWRWIAENPAHGVAFAKVEAGWDAAEALQHGKHGSADAASAPTGEPAQGFGALSPRRISRRTFGLIAAGSSIAAAAMFALGRLPTPARYATKVGEERQVQLADGSTILLNTDSVVEVNLHPGRRTIHLLRGEAHFDLARADSRPFTVGSHEATLQAAEAIFNLRQWKDCTEVTVMNGTINVLDDGLSATVVQAGSAAKIRTAAIEIAQLSQPELARRTAWQQGNIALDHETLGQAVEEFNRYRIRPLVIGDPTLAQLRMGGTFSASHSDDFVAALKETFGIHAYRKEDGTTLLLSENGVDS